MSESPVSSAGTEHDSLQSLIDGLLAANDPLGAMAATYELDALAPDSPTPCRLRGDVYAWLRMWDAALVQYQYAMARDVEDTRAHCAAATARYELGDLDSALALLDGALALEPHSLRARDTLYRIVSTEVQRPNDASNVLRSMPRSLFMAWTRRVPGTQPKHA
jgi:tetratricopeptide (TPR) repeat protein